MKILFNGDVLDSLMPRCFIREKRERERERGPRRDINTNGCFVINEKAVCESFLLSRRWKCDSSKAERKIEARSLTRIQSAILGWKYLDGRGFGMVIALGQVQSDFLSGLMNEVGLC